jgi:hypothetical protein
MLARLFGVMRRVRVVAVRHMGVMASLLMIPRRMMLGSRPVMLRRMLGSVLKVR